MYLHFDRNVLHIEQRPDITDAGNRLPVGADDSESFALSMSNAAARGKEPSGMKRQESSPTSSSSTERLGGWHKFAAVGALSAIALTGCATNNAEAKGPASETTTSAPAETEAPELTPLEKAEQAYEATLLSPEELTEQFRIPAGLSDEELATKFLENVDNWMNYGANPELPAYIYEIADSDVANELYRKVADEAAAAIIPAMFVSNWQESGVVMGGHNQLADFVPNIQGNNARIMSYYNKTSGDFSSDVEPYRRWSELASVESLGDNDTQRELFLVYRELSNDDKNRADDLGAGEVDAKGLLIGASVTFDEIDGFEYVSKLEIGQMAEMDK